MTADPLRGRHIEPDDAVVPDDIPPALASEEDPPLGPCRVHPAWILIGVVQWLRALGLPLVIALFSGGNRAAQLFYAGAILLAVIVSVIRLLQWARFRYAVVHGELRVTSGLVARQERLIPLERIQAVDSSENLLQRLFGVVGVKIETAAGGAGDSDVTPDALTREDARRLRDRLVAAVRPTTPSTTAGGVAAPAEREPARLIRAISPAELLLAGATSARVAPALVIVISGLQLVEDVFRSNLPKLLGIEPPERTLAAAAAFLLVLAVLGWLLAIASSVLTFAGFELRRDGDRLLISYGLLDRRRRVVPLARIQAVRVSEGILRQPFGLAAMRFESAGYGNDTAGSGVLFPLLPRSQVEVLLAAACPMFAPAPDAGRLNGLPARACRRYVLQAVWGVLLITAVAVAVAAILPTVPWWWARFLLMLAPPAALFGLLRYRDSGWSVDDDGRLIVRGRGIGRLTTMTLRRRLQHRSVSRGPFQRRARLATFRAAVASGRSGGGIAVIHLDESVACALAERLGPDPARRLTDEG